MPPPLVPDPQWPDRGVDFRRALRRAWHGGPSDRGAHSASAMVEEALAPWGSTVLEKSPALQAVPWTDLENWQRNDPRPALGAFLKSCQSLSRWAAWAGVCAEAKRHEGAGPEEVRRFFEHSFLPHQVTQEDGGCTMDHTFIFFPTRDIAMTPQGAGLTYEDVFFTASDGVQIHGWFVPGKPQAPVVLFFHGNAGNISHRVDNLYLFHQNLGVSVFIIDYRGYGHSSGKASEEGTYADARGALAWLHKNSWDNDQIIYFGRSLGAAVATQLAIEEPPAGLVLESPFTSVAAMGRRHNPILFFLLGWLLNSNYDTLAKIDRIKAPLLLLHGSKDTLVPPAMSEQLFDRAIEPKTLHLIHGAGHNDTLSHRQTEYWQTWRRFIEDLHSAPTARATP